MITTARLLLAPLLLATALLGGCAATPSTASAPSEAPTAAVSPTPTPTSTTVVAPAPAPVFGGDCGNVLTDEEVGRALGSPVTSVAADIGSALSPLDMAVEQLGGLHCRWARVDDASVTSWLTVLPASAGSADELDQLTCYGPCSFGTASSGFWLAGVVYPSADPAQEESRAAVAALSAAFASSAARQPMPAAPSPAPGQWAATIDCQQLSDAAGVPTALADPGLQAARGNYPGEAGPGAYGAARSAGVTNCMWTAQENSGSRGPLQLQVQLLPGGGWVQARVEGLPEATPVTVPGADAAFVVTTHYDGGEDRVLHVFAAGNWMTLQPGSTLVSVEDVLPAAPALLTALVRA